MGSFTCRWLLAWTVGAASVAAVQAQEDTIALVVGAGRPLRVAVESRVRVKRVGQPVSATLLEPVYVHDRIVIPAGAKVRGRIERLDPPRTRARLAAVLRSDFSPARAVGLRFETLVLTDGREIPISTHVGPGMANVALSVSAPRPKKSLPGRAGTAVKEAAKGKVRQATDAVKRRGRWRRFRDAFLASLPFHAQYLREGTVYEAELLASLDFGVGTKVARAPAGTPAPTDSILAARLVTALSSASTARGTEIRAVLTVPLFSSEQELILPEGTELLGEVTFARPARHFHRHGQLRLLFESARVPDEGARSLLASLYAAEVGGGARLAIDDEGGARMTDSKRRFVAPALSLGALGASFAMEPSADPGKLDPGEVLGGMEPNSLGTAAGGFSGLGLVGIGLSQLSRPTALGLGVVGAGRSVYASLLGKGREVSFPAGTRIQVQLAPPSAPSPAQAPLP